MFEDKITHHLTLHIIQCRKHNIFVSKQSLVTWSRLFQRDQPYNVSSDALVVCISICCSCQKLEQKLHKILSVPSKCTKYYSTLFFKYFCNLFEHLFIFSCFLFVNICLQFHIFVNIFYNFIFCQYVYNFRCLPFCVCVFD